MRVRKSSLGTALPVPFIARVRERKAVGLDRHGLNYQGLSGLISRDAAHCAPSPRTRPVAVSPPSPCRRVVVARAAVVVVPCCCCRQAASPCPGHGPCDWTGSGGSLTLVKYEKIRTGILNHIYNFFGYSNKLFA